MKRLVFSEVQIFPKHWLTYITARVCTRCTNRSMERAYAFDQLFMYTVHCWNGHDFLLVFRSNYSPVSCRFRYKWWDNCKIFPPPLFDAPSEGFPWNFCNGSEARKLEWKCTDSPSQNCDDRSIRFDTVPALVRQTDRQTDGQNW